MRRAIWSTRAASGGRSTTRCHRPSSRRKQRRDPGIEPQPSGRGELPHERPTCGAHYRGAPMSTVINLPVGNEIRTTFDRVAKLVPQLSQSTAEQRIARIRRLMAATLAARPRIYEAVKAERGLSPPDVDGELVMLKMEAEHIEKHLADWMSDKSAPPSLMTLGQKCYLHYEAKRMVLVLPSWNAPYVICFLPVPGALALKRGQRPGAACRRRTSVARL